MAFAGQTPVVLRIVLYGSGYFPKMGRIWPYFGPNSKSESTTVLFSQSAGWGMSFGGEKFQVVELNLLPPGQEA